MPPPSTEPAPPSPDLETALQVKRAALDREVERFRAAKESEFRQFEVQLRRDAAAAGPVAPAQPRPSRAAGNPDERALRDVFAAPYISLLDRPRDGRPPSPPPSADRSTSTVSATSPSHSSAPPSPDASLLPSSDPSPPIHARPTAHGDDHDAATPHAAAAGHQRRASSSPVPASALRSSLRRAAPRAPPPKHVLFAIDNALLSPRSSPLARRRPHMGLPLPQPPGGANAGGDGHRLADAAGRGTARGARVGDAERDAVAMARREEGTEADQEGDDEGEGEDEAAIFVPRVSPARVPPQTALLASPPRRSYRELVEPTGLSGASPLREARAVETGADDDDGFAAGLGDGDPLFDFEEGGGVAEWDEEEEGTKGEKDEGSGEPEGEMEEESPRAGSLPIEIRWPGRRS